MDLSGIAAVIVALVGSGGILAVGKAVWSAAKTAAKNDILVEQARATNAEKDKELARLWRLIDHLTDPEGDE